MVATDELTAVFINNVHENAMCSEARNDFHVRNDFVIPYAHTSTPNPLTVKP